MKFQLSDASQLTLPIRRAMDSLRRYVDAKSFPPMTTAERDELSPSAGDTVFNTTLSKHQGWDGSTWQNLY